MAKRIVVTFKKGTATIETDGFADSSCQTATAEFERRLGKVTGETLKPEAFVMATEAERATH